jgi:hypothetical protein
MGEMKFASKSDAIQHLSNVTGQRIKIAWDDQSREMVEAIGDDVMKNPALFLKFFGRSTLKDVLDLDPNSNLRPSNTKKLYEVQPVENSKITKAVVELINTKNLKDRAELIDTVLEDKDFEKFHSKYPKGVQKDEDGPYYRSKQDAGLLKRTWDKVRGESGEEGEADRQIREDKEKAEKQSKAEAEKAEKESKKELEEAVAADMSTYSSKIKALAKGKWSTTNEADMESFFKKPFNKILQKNFLDAFKQEVTKMNADQADKFVGLFQTLAKRTEAKYGDKLPKFVSEIEKLAVNVNKAEEKLQGENLSEAAGQSADSAQEAAGESEERGFTMTDPQTGVTVKGSDFDSVIDDIVNGWIKTKNL